MFFVSSTVQVYLALGNTDMRKSINGLSILVQEHLEMNPLSGHLFVFCNRGRNIIQVLYWDRNGFCLWKKRLEKHKFTWPESAREVMEIDQRQLWWLLEGLDMCRMKAHESLRYSTLV
jgi:transposase